VQQNSPVCGPKLGNGKDTYMPMTKTEARELKSLVRADFDALEEAVQVRVQNFDRIILKERQRRNKEVSQEVAARFAALRRRFRKLQHDAEDMFDELEKEGWDINSYGSGPFQVNLDLDRVKPPNYDDHEDLQEASEELWVQSTQAESDLTTQKNQFLRDLTLNMLESDEAIAFVHSIPTVEQALPASTLIAQLSQ
jgi:hypothetical protein